VIFLFNIDDILSENFSNYPEETRAFMNRYAMKLRENIKNELVKDLANRMLKDIDKSKDHFINVLTEIMDNGVKGYDKMSTKMLLNMYLERKDEQDFIKLLEAVNLELEAENL
jgi:hypothetical protein